MSFEYPDWSHPDWMKFIQIDPSGDEAVDFVERARRSQRQSDSLGLTRALKDRREDLLRRSGHTPEEGWVYYYPYWRKDRGIGQITTTDLRIIRKGLPEGVELLVIPGDYSGMAAFLQEGLKTESVTTYITYRPEQSSIFVRIAPQA